MTARRLDQPSSLYPGNALYFDVVWWKRCLPPGEALGQHQEHHEKKQQPGQLRRAGDVVHVQPYVIDAEREGADGEKVDGAEIIQGFPSTPATRR